MPVFISFFLLIIFGSPVVRNGPNEANSILYEGLKVRFESVKKRGNLITSTIFIENVSLYTIILRTPGNKKELFEMLQYGAISPSIIINSDTFRYNIVTSICKKYYLEDMTEVQILKPGTSTPPIKFKFAMRDFKLKSASIRDGDSASFTIRFKYNNLDVQADVSDYFLGTIESSSTITR